MSNTIKEALILAGCLLFVAAALAIPTLAFFFPTL